MYIYISTTRACALLQRCSSFLALPWKLLRTYLDSWSNIVQAVVSARPPAPSSSRPPSCWHVALHVRSRNLSKSTLAHDAVAAVVLHKHHLIIWVGAGLIQFFRGSHSRMAVDLTLDKINFRSHFRGVLCVYTHTHTHTLHRWGTWLWAKQSGISTWRARRIQMD